MALAHADVEMTTAERLDRIERAMHTLAVSTMRVARIVDSDPDTPLKSLMADVERRGEANRADSN